MDGELEEKLRKALWAAEYNAEEQGAVLSAHAAFKAIEPIIDAAIVELEHSKTDGAT